MGACSSKPITATAGTATAGTAQKNNNQPTTTTADQNNNNTDTAQSIINSTTPAVLATTSYENSTAATVPVSKEDEPSGADGNILSQAATTKLSNLKLSIADNDIDSRHARIISRDFADSAAVELLMNSTAVNSNNRHTLSFSHSSVSQTDAFHLANQPHNLATAFSNPISLSGGSRRTSASIPGPIVQTDTGDYIVIPEEVRSPRGNNLEPFSPVIAGPVLATVQDPFECRSPRPITAETEPLTVEPEPLTATIAPDFEVRSPRPTYDQTHHQHHSHVPAQFHPMPPHFEHPPIPTHMLGELDLRSPRPMPDEESLERGTTQPFSTPVYDFTNGHTGRHIGFDTEGTGGLTGPIIIPTIHNEQFSPAIPESLDVRSPRPFIADDNQPFSPALPTEFDVRSPRPTKSNGVSPVLESIANPPVIPEELDVRSPRPLMSELSSPNPFNTHTTSSLPGHNRRSTGTRPPLNSQLSVPEDREQDYPKDQPNSKSQSPETSQTHKTPGIFHFGIGDSAAASKVGSKASSRVNSRRPTPIHSRRNSLNDPNPKAAIAAAVAASIAAEKAAAGVAVAATATTSPRISLGSAASTNSQPTVTINNNKFQPSFGSFNMNNLKQPEQATSAECSPDPLSATLSSPNSPFPDHHNNSTDSNVSAVSATATETIKQQFPIQAQAQTQSQTHNKRQSLQSLEPVLDETETEPIETTVTVPTIVVDAPAPAPAATVDAVPIEPESVPITVNIVPVTEPVSESTAVESQSVSQSN